MSVKKKDVVLMAYYAIKHTSSRPGRLNVVQITQVCAYGGWWAVNLKTGRTIRIKSNAKLRHRVTKNSQGRWEVVADK